MMKKKGLFLLALIPTWAFAQPAVQWSDDFSDGDFTQNPAWSGTDEHFIVNAEGRLQSNAPAGSRSFLSTSSEAFDDAEWEFWVRINLNPSQNNYSRVYLISDKADLSGNINGYYVEIGSSSDDISLYRQQGSKRTKIIDGADKIIDANPVTVHVRVTRTKAGVFSLFRKRTSDLPDFIDNEFVREGVSVVDNEVRGCRFFGVLFVNTNTTGKSYFFDDIAVKGDKFMDITAPEWLEMRIEEPNRLVLTFSEPIDISLAVFQIDQGVGEPVSTTLSDDEMSVVLTFADPFRKGVVYSINAINVKDLYGNLLLSTQKQIGIVEQAEQGDVAINEILFDNSDVAPEYFEIYNNSAKILNLSNLFFAVRNTAGRFSTGNLFPAQSTLLPFGYMALTADAASVRSAYIVPDTANIVRSERWSALNNSSASLLVGTLVSVAPGITDTIILDEVRYDAKWHHPLVRQPKGVALERINPAMPSQSAGSWHSASSDANYGTPGYKNSQYRSILGTDMGVEQWFVPDPEAFTPDNDGRDDVCFIRYKSNVIGFSANVIIFNAVGEKITQLAHNQILGSEGYLTWDGKTDRRVSANPGIYVLYVELINLSSGIKKVEKMPIVVSAR